LLAAVLIAGQFMSGQEVSRFSFDVGGGFTQPVGNTGRHLDEGWNIRGGAGINFSEYVGAMVQLDYNRFGINGTTLNTAGFPDGDVSVFSATLDPIVHLTPRGHFDVYLIGGGGLYHRTQEFTQPGLAAVTGFDPFFGFYQTAIPTTQVVSSYTVNKPASTAVRVSRSEPSGMGNFSPRLAITGFSWVTMHTRTISRCLSVSVGKAVILRGRNSHAGKTHLEPAFAAKH
jgi:hypothetical protein